MSLDGTYLTSVLRRMSAWRHRRPYSEASRLSQKPHKSATSNARIVPIAVPVRMEMPDKSVVEAGADQRDDRGALERGIRRRHVLVEKTVPRSVRLGHGGSVRECRQFGNTLLPNSNLRWEAIDDDVLVAVGEHVTRAVRIMAMIDPRDPSSHRCSSRGRRRHAPARGRCGRPGRCDRCRARELLATCPSANSPLDLGIFVECPLRARSGRPDAR